MAGESAEFQNDYHTMYCLFTCGEREITAEPRAKLLYGNKWENSYLNQQILV